MSCTYMFWFYSGYVRPSRELLEYYRTKIAEYDGEYENLIKRLQKYKSAYEHMVKTTQFWCCSSLVCMYKLV